VTTTAASPRAPVELCSRTNDGIEVTLLWTPGADRLTVSVVDSRLSTAFRLAAAPAEAKRVFDHPYAYAASRGLLDDDVPTATAAQREPVAALT
jgi:hypothetical protein